MMTNGDPEGRIFLSHPHTNNGFFSLLTTIYLILNWKKHETDFKKILNMLRFDVVTSFKDYNDIAHRCAADVKLFVFYLSLGLVWVCEINRIHHWCSVGTKKSQLEGPPFQWETRLAEFPTERWTRGLGFFWNH